MNALRFSTLSLSLANSLWTTRTVPWICITPGWRERMKQEWEFGLLCLPHFYFLQDDLPLVFYRRELHSTTGKRPPHPCSVLQTEKSFSSHMAVSECYGLCLQTQWKILNLSKPLPSFMFSISGWIAFANKCVPVLYEGFQAHKLI